MLSEEADQMATATQVAGAISPQEIDLLNQMAQISEQARHQPDSKIKQLEQWLRQLCPNLGQPGATWLNRQQFQIQILTKGQGKQENQEVIVQGVEF